MIRIAILLQLLSGFPNKGNGQIFDEWFNQKATQKKYLIQQVAALQVYINYLQKGYRVTQKGLHAISTIKNTHLSLDKDFFATLEKINPNIKKGCNVGYSKLLGVWISLEHERISKDLNQSGLLSQNEIAYIHDVFDDVLKERTATNVETDMLLTPGKLKMSDGERIKRLTLLQNHMKDILVFTTSFCNSIKYIIRQRSCEEKETQNIRNIQSIK